MNVLIQYRHSYDLAVLSGFQGVLSDCPCWLIMAIAPFETWRLELAPVARRDWLKPPKKLYSSTKTAPISESRRRLVTLFATWRES